jgi:hypothetical protein
MRKITLILTTMFLSIGMYAATDINVSLCDNKDSKTITREALSSCNDLTLNTKDWKIKSFQIGFVSDGNYHEIKNTENRISENGMSSLKKFAPTMIYIEKIIIVNRTGEEKNLGAMKVIITD